MMGVSVKVMMFNATFKNISVILSWSVLLVEETRVPGKNLPQVPDKLYHKMCKVKSDERRKGNQLKKTGP
jgi:superfamily II DNA/RNA helicase